MKRIRTLVLSFLFACAVLFVPFAVNAGYGIQNVAAAEEDDSTTDYSTKYVVLSLEGLTIGQGFYITPTRMSYEEIGNYIKEGKADAGIGIIEEVGIGVSDELHNLLAEKDLYITHCKVQEDGGVRRKVVTFTDKLVVLPSHNRVKVMFECPNHSGSISSILSMISDYGVNLTEIHSRPFWKDNSWNYKFFVEMNANIDTKEIRALIYQLSQETAYLKILGSYACEGDF